MVDILWNGPIKKLVGSGGFWVGFFFHLAKPANLVGGVFTSRIGFCLKNYQSMKQLLPGHSSSLSNLLCVPTPILFLFLNCRLWLWCAARLHESDMRKEISAGRQDPWRHEPYALIVLGFFLLLSCMKRKAWSLAYYTDNTMWRLFCP